MEAADRNGWEAAACASGAGIITAAVSWRGGHLQSPAPNEFNLVAGEEAGLEEKKRCCTSSTTV